MKKILILLAAITLVFGLVGCSEKSASKEEPKEDTVVEEAVEKEETDESVDSEKADGGEGAEEVDVEGEMSLETVIEQMYEKTALEMPRHTKM